MVQPGSHTGFLEGFGAADGFADGVDDDLVVRGAGVSHEGADGVFEVCFVVADDGFGGDVEVAVADEEHGCLLCGRILIAGGKTKPGWIHSSPVRTQVIVRFCFC